MPYTGGDLCCNMCDVTSNDLLVNTLLKEESSNKAMELLFSTGKGLSSYPN